MEKDKIPKVVSDMDDQLEEQEWDALAKWVVTF